MHDPDAMPPAGGSHTRDPETGAIVPAQHAAQPDPIQSPDVEPANHPE